MTPCFGHGEKKIDHYRGAVVHADVSVHHWAIDALRDLGIKQPVLDLGCGDGALTRRLFDEGVSVLGADIIELPDVPFPHVRLDLEDDEAVRQFAIENNGAFGAVLLVEVIEHLADPERAFKLAASVLAPGGVLLISTPNVTSFLSRLVFLVHGRFFQFWPDDERYGHLRPITWWELDARLSRSGFTVVSQGAAGSLPRFWFHGGVSGSVFHAAAAALAPVMRGPKWGWALTVVARMQQDLGRQVG